MKYAAILWLSCLSVLGQSPLLTGSGIDWTRLLSSAVNFPTNYPATLTGNEHFWLASDLTNGPSVLWTDRGPAKLTWWKHPTDNPPTNDASGLRFDGTQSMTNVDKNGSGGSSSMSANDQVNFRIFCAVYSTTNGLSEGFLTDQTSGSLIGVNFNSSGGAGSTAGLFSMQPQNNPTDTIGNGLKTDGTLQDVCAAQTTITANSSYTGYTNGVSSISLASYMTGHPLNFLGEGFNLLKAHVVAIATFTNVANQTILCSNWHAWRTNIFGGSP